MSPIEVAVRVVVGLLVRREYMLAEQVTGGRQMSGVQMATAIAEYGRTLVNPGEGWWPLVVVTPVSEGGGRVLHVAAPLWTLEEGRSDLTLEIRLTESPAHTFDAEILDLHVL